MTQEQAIQLATEPFDAEKKPIYDQAYAALYGEPYTKGKDCGCDQVSDVYNKLVVAVQNINERRRNEN